VEEGMKYLVLSPAAAFPARSSFYIRTFNN
jgi:hypothetical protein